MPRLKTNKTKLYKLVSEYEPLPPMRRVRLRKAYRSPDWQLEWVDANDLRCKASLFGSLAPPKLVIEKRTRHWEQVSRVVYTMDQKRLIERGMVEEFTTAAERRRLEREAAHGMV